MNVLLRVKRNGKSINILVNKRQISAAKIIRVFTKARYLALAGIGGSMYTLNLVNKMKS